MHSESLKPHVSTTRTILRVAFTSLIMFGFQTYDHNAQSGMDSTANLMERIGYSVFMGLILGWILPWISHRWPNAWVFRWKIHR